MDKQISFDGLPPKEKIDNTNKNAKRRWERGFQKWSDQQGKDRCSTLGKCGYGSMCDYCICNYKGNPCVRALNSMCREKRIKINYENRNYEEIWNL